MAAGVEPEEPDELVDELLVLLDEEDELEESLLLLSEAAGLGSVLPVVLSELEVPLLVLPDPERESLR